MIILKRVSNGNNFCACCGKIIPFRNKTLQIKGIDENMIIDEHHFNQFLDSDESALKFTFPENAEQVEVTNEGNGD